MNVLPSLLLTAGLAGKLNLIDFEGKSDDWVAHRGKTDDVLARSWPHEAGEATNRPSDEGVGVESHFLESLRDDGVADWRNDFHAALHQEARGRSYERENHEEARGRGGECHRIQLVNNVLKTQATCGIGADVFTCERHLDCHTGRDGNRLGRDFFQVLAISIMSVAIRDSGRSCGFAV